jgi:biotin-(acetyl-CoA carboxylase) ligase
LSDAATSVADAIQQPGPLSSSELESTLLRNIDGWYSVLHEADGPEKIRKAWEQRSSYFQGKEVSVQVENEVITGVTDGLEEDGALRIVTGDGPRIVRSGDVTRLRKIVD